MSIPSLKEFSVLFPNEDAVFDFLYESNVFYEVINCPNCNSGMKRYKDSRLFRCNKLSCSKRSKYSINKNTFFYNCSLSYIDVLQLALFWLSKCPVSSTIVLSGHSSHTVCSFFSFFRQLVGDSLLEDDQIIGGPGIIVEIDETKLGKRKYHRGHRVDGVWVLVGIERGGNGNIFLVSLVDRSARSLDSLILSHVRIGSEIHTDCWRGYSNLNNLGYIHKTVNHSITFKDESTGACTNTAEGLNSGLKSRIPVRNRVENGVGNHLLEYVWRRKNNNTLFRSFVDALRDVHYDN
jgi:ISXO2-like transposase domain